MSARLSRLIGMPLLLIAIDLAAIVMAAAIASGGAFAQEAQSTEEPAPTAALRYRVVGDLDAAREAGAWPVREHDEDAQAAVAPRAGRKARRRPRKEYPNVMGMPISQWLAGRS
ncbi:MAG: hypothetical protein ACJ8G7_01430 [Rhizobacter sp.]